MTAGSRAAQPEREPPLHSIPAQWHGKPTVLRIALGNQLRRLREAREITCEAAGNAIRGSGAKISRLELGRVGFKERDVADLLTLYGVTDKQQRDTFLTLARQANTPGWWRQYGDVLPPWFETYLGLEQAASVLRIYEPQLVPALLQTEDCARAIIRLRRLHDSAEEIDRHVALQMTRQDFLTQPGAPDLWVTLDEAVLRRPVGSREAQRAQLRHLIEMTELPTITLQVVPFAVGGHVAAAGGPFTILRFAEPDLPDIVYLEHLTSALYLDKKRDTSDYLMVMDTLCVQAKSPDETVGFLYRVLAEE
ncbi:MAG TPA: helix-turn-helix transcriptional regulator [Pseudonocardiaceae bacterium]|nr:helix-turn-helix transcriptional regulator [Pseudonocardiaceae bacterium]